MEHAIQQLTGHRVELLCKGGAFSKAYRSCDDTTVVFIVSPSNDPAKGILANIENNQHIPTMRRIANIGNNQVLWQTVYSNPVTPENNTAYYQMKNLASKWAVLRDTNRKVSTNELVQRFIAILTPNRLFTVELISALTAICNQACDTEMKIMFDMPVENFGLDTNGNLILRDVMLFREMK